MSRTPLEKAVESEDREAVKARLAAGDDPDAHAGVAVARAMALPGDRIDILELLHRPGSKIDNTIGWGFHYAVRRNNLKVVRWAIAHRLDLEGWGPRALDVAKNLGLKEMAEIIRAAMGTKES
jgi:hypothetical protein